MSSQLAIDRLESEHASFITKIDETHARTENLRTTARDKTTEIETEQYLAELAETTIISDVGVVDTYATTAETYQDESAVSLRDTASYNRQTKEEHRQAKIAKKKSDSLAAGDYDRYKHWLLNSPVANGTLHLDFANQAYQVWENGALKDKTFAEALTFTRASTKWVWDATGTLVEVPVDEPAYDHDPVTGEPLGILIEPGATNKIPRSEGMWSTYAGNSEVEEVIGGFDGVRSSFKITSNATVNGGYAYKNSSDSVIGERDTGSVYIKAGNTDSITLMLSRRAGDITGTDITVPDDGHFHRVSLTSVVWTGSRGMTLRVYPGGRLGDTAGLYVFVALPQIESGPVATSYIPTAGAAVTRAADNMSRTLGAEFNPMALSVVATAMTRDPRIGSAGANAGAPNIFALYESYDRNLYLNRRSAGGYNNRLQLSRTDLGDDTLDINSHIVGPVESFPANKWMRVGVSVDTTSSVLVSDGVSFGTSGGAIGLDTLSNFEVGRGINGYVKELHLYPYALTEQELIDLTS